MSVVPGSPPVQAPSENGFAPDRTVHAEFHAELIGSRMVLIGVRGDIDMLSAPAFRDYVSDRVGADRRMILDMSEIDFIGTAGLRVLEVFDSAIRDSAMEDSAMREQQPGRLWGIICGRSMRRLLRATGQESQFPCYGSLDGAMDSWMAHSAP